MALRPARTCCTAWLPVSAPSACDVVLGVEQLPEALRAERRERVLDLERAAQPLDVRLRVGADDAVEALRVRARDTRTASQMVGLGDRGVDDCELIDGVSCGGRVDASLGVIASPSW